MFLLKKAPTEHLDTGICIEVLPLSERMLAARRWQGLEKRLGNTTLKNSWCWINTWLDHFTRVTHDGCAVPCVFIFGVAQNQDVGAALLPVSYFDLGVLTVPTVAIGTAGEPLRERTYIQYNQLLVESEYLNAFAQGLMSYLVKQKWSVLWIECFLPLHAQALIEAGQNAGLSLTAIEEPLPTFDFGQLSPGEEIWRGISHDQRSKIRRSMKQFAASFGPLSIEWATTRVQAQNILDELIELHTNQWLCKGDTGSFRTQRLRDYHKQLVDTFFPQNLIAFRVKYGETTAGCLINLVENDSGHITNHRSGFPIFTDNRLKPGYITNVLFMQEAMKRGYTEFDFLDGHVDYKRHLTNAQHTLVSIEAYRGLRSKAFQKTREIYRRSRANPFIEKIKRYLVK